MTHPAYISSRVAFVRNLPFKLKPEELYSLFGRFGSVRQIRRGTGPGTRGTAFVVFDDVEAAKKAIEQLNGFHVAGRYLVCVPFSPKKEED